ncbi:DUF3825 domain-containing protein [Halosquirtibacter xylanolyticus]|uniref:DUF3825 domain-containing protein n=1 Tax=Halosquirtibacter xylanolyticus TaxID=3374599 RepID=UPI0037487477|nr:DUF3825 domain-containing protein [Prolixibacteraceae bacterium]
MKLFKHLWFGNFNNPIEELKDLAMDENWGKTNDKHKHPILVSYVWHTFERLWFEKKVVVEGDYCCFNTGLVTKNQEEIFGYAEVNKKPEANIPFFFKGWRKSSDRDLTKFKTLGETANYIKNPADLIYDTTIELRQNIDHIIEDNKSRFPKEFIVMGDHLLSNILQGAIEDAKKRVKRNYKTAIPQFYDGKLQLLLPLCLKTKACADLALVIEKENDDVYRAATCLTLEMAINNARLIAKPDDEWLKV